MSQHNPHIGMKLRRTNTPIGLRYDTINLVCRHEVVVNDIQDSQVQLQIISGPVFKAGNTFWIALHDLNDALFIKLAET